jgi:hypothetical protein
VAGSSNLSTPLKIQQRGAGLAVKLNNEIEKALWADVYKNQLSKADYPIGEATARAQHTTCSDYADKAVVIFRARAGEHSHTEVTVQTLTNDTKFQELHV